MQQRHPPQVGQPRGHLLGAQAERRGQPEKRGEVWAEPSHPQKIFMQQHHLTMRRDSYFAV